MSNFKALMIMLVIPCIGFAAKITDYSFVNNQIIVLHISEGYVDHFGIGESNDDNLMFKDALDVNASVNISNYTLLGLNCDDQTVNAISSIGRKSKARDINGAWSSPDFVLEHWIYIKLNCPITENQVFELQFNGLFDRASMPIIYNAHRSPSPIIHVNNLGYTPQAKKKIAYVSGWMGSMGPLDLTAYEGNEFHLLELSTFNYAFSGNLVLRKDLETGGPDIAYGDGDSPRGNFAGADVYECDFSDFTGTGNYVLVVDAIGVSNPFFIHPNVYQEAFYVITRALYHHRSGLELKSEYTDYPRPRDHHPAESDTVILSTWRYKDGGNAFTQLPQFATGEKRPYWGGWQDAGDWDRNHNHLRGVHALLMIYEFFPSKFSDNELNIPERNNGIPDILDEVRWSIDLFKRMQNDDGGISGGVETTRHPESGVSSPNDTDQWYAYAPDPCASFHYAAAAAQFAVTMGITGDDNLRTEYLNSAIRAYVWAVNHTIPDEENAVRDYRQQAAAYLFKATGDVDYQNTFINDNLIATANTPLYEYQSHDQQKAAWCYASTDNATIDLSLKNTIRDACINWAISDNISTAEMRSSRMGYHWWTPTGWSAATTPQNLPLVAAYYLSGDQQFIDYQYTTADYFLGGNPLNMTWATQLGENHPKQVLHLDSWYYNDGNIMIPGIVPYGPMRYSNNSYPDFWNPEYGMNSCFPNADDWPSHELWFNNRYAASTNEYTVWQTIAPSAAAYAALKTGSGNIWPNAEITAPNLLSAHNPSGAITFEATAKDWDGQIEKVEYFAFSEADQQVTSLGQGLGADYTLDWHNSKPGFFSVTAKATDNLGACGYSKPILLYSGMSTRVTGHQNSHISIHPNPATDQLNIFLDRYYPSLRVDLIDQNGRRIFRKSFFNIGSKIELQIPDHLTGVFIVEIGDGDVRFRQSVHFVK